MDQILIHIGFHKTGTTWLQNEVFINGNIAFQPLSENYSGESTLARDFIFDQQGYLLNSFDLNENVIKKNLSLIFGNYPNPQEKIFVMSHERLSGNPHSSGFDASTIANRLKNVFPEGKILIGIREQKSFILSNYFQYLSIGGTMSLKRYLHTKYDGKRPCFSPNHLDYFYVISNYYNLFGKENVLVLPYELFHSNKLEYFRLLSDFVGKNISIDQSSFRRFRNRKSDHFINYHLRHLNLFVRSSSVNNFSIWAKSPIKDIVQFLLRALKKMSPQSFDRNLQKHLKEQIDEFVVDRFEKSNKMVDSITTIDLSKYGYF